MTLGVFISLETLRSMQTLSSSHWLLLLAPRSWLLAPDVSFLLFHCWRRPAYSLARLCVNESTQRLSCLVNACPCLPPAPAPGPAPFPALHPLASHIPFNHAAHTLASPWGCFQCRLCLHSSLAPLMLFVYNKRRLNLLRSALSQRHVTWPRAHPPQQTIT